MPPTATPPYSELVYLSSGHAVLIERTWSMGDLFIGLAVVALIAVIGLRWLYALAQQREAA